MICFCDFSQINQFFQKSCGIRQVEREAEAERDACINSVGSRGASISTQESDGTVKEFKEGNIVELCNMLMAADENGSDGVGKKKRFGRKLHG